MWDEESNVDVLSDDRIIIRKKGREFWMYGTPWHGEEQFSSPRSVRLEKIFFVKHGKKNVIKDMKGIDPVNQLVRSSFPPHWNSQGMAFALEVFSQLASQVPCQELAFKPDKTTLDLINRTAN
jgi:hypothetical protein